MSVLRSIAALLALLLAAACNVPAPSLSAGPARALAEGPSRFLLFRHGDAADVIRTSVEPAPSTPAVARRAGRAVARATGCGVAWIRGDAAQLRLGLDCPGRIAPRPPDPPPELDCLALDLDAPPGAVHGELGLDCAGLPGIRASAAVPLSR
ncbi:hypothetical protein ROJ8625_00592 [Roseivivax jejudonensis]|uniref:Histidine phosphatase superfamily (Branch 1) n=1 Tax=Roseivivax jejudonensis TaxID=1529041 RepID=A0A1X6YDB3_9RHOB|nr:hypothetical protein [Roseivivax jejudonensis]SLN17945.1 hypothetical protein ROJ8625_00592 [Roseivivax jejudonensis]